VQVKPPGQLVQVLPLVPHACADVPEMHSPAEVQQPLHVRESQVDGVLEHAVTKKMAKSAKAKRMGGLLAQRLR
jgi:hypothetical protein